MQQSQCCPACRWVGGCADDAAFSTQCHELMATACKPCSVFQPARQQATVQTVHAPTHAPRRRWTVCSSAQSGEQQRRHARMYGQQQGSSSTLRAAAHQAPAVVSTATPAATLQMLESITQVGPLDVSVLFAPSPSIGYLVCSHACHSVMHGCRCLVQPNEQWQQQAQQWERRTVAATRTACCAVG